MSTERRRIREKLATEYRMACPRGHTSLQPAETTATAYCQACGRAYGFDDLVDRRCEPDGAAGSEGGTSEAGDDGCETAGGR